MRVRVSRVELVPLAVHEQMSELLSPRDIMHELRVGRTTALAIMRRLPRVMVGRLPRTPRAAFETWIRARTQQPAPDLAETLTRPKRRRGEPGGRAPGRAASPSVERWIRPSLERKR